MLLNKRDFSSIKRLSQPDNSIKSIIESTLKVINKDNLISIIKENEVKELAINFISYNALPSGQGDNMRYIAIVESILRLVTKESNEDFTLNFNDIYNNRFEIAIDFGSILPLKQEQT